MPRDLIAYPDVELDEMGEVLMKAADIVERGWCREGFHRPGAKFAGGYMPDRYCMMGAILRIEDLLPAPIDGEKGLWLSLEAHQAIDEFAERLGFGGVCEMYAWNDDQLDWRPVVARMRKAAVKSIPVGDE